MSKSPLKTPAKPSAEADLEAGVAAALPLAFPRLRRADLEHQVEFTVRLGHATITVKGRESWVRRGRADIVVRYRGRPLAVLELKKPGATLTADDATQGLSYARLLPEMAPFVVVTNGAEVALYETHSGQAWTAESPDDAAFAAVLAAAAKVAADDRHGAIATLMGTDPQVWTQAVADASEAALQDLTATADLPLLPFGRLRIPRQATRTIGQRLSAGKRLVLLSGEPQSGKTNVLGELVRLAQRGRAGVLFVEGAPRHVFRRVADLLADTLDWPVDPEQARAWARTVSRAGGPLLVVVFDKLNPNERDDVRAVEDLLSPAFGPSVVVVAGIDRGATRAALVSEDGRGHSAIGRLAEIVEVAELSDTEFVWATKGLAELGLGIMEGGQYNPDLRHPWLLQALASRSGGGPSPTIAVFPAVPGLDVLGQARAQPRDPELRRRYQDLARAVVAEAQAQDKPATLALQLTSRYVLRRTTLKENVHTDDIAWLMSHGYLTPAIGEGNLPIVSIALPELLASELALHLSGELRKLVATDPKDAAAWLSGAASNFLLGDVVAAQALLDLARQETRLSWRLYDALVDMTPERDEVRAGQHLVGWVEGVGKVEIKPQADGSTLMVVAGEEHRVEADEVGYGAGLYGNIHGWLILSHLASRRFVVELDGKQIRLDPEAMLMVGTADFVLRAPRNDILMDVVPTEDLPDGGQIVTGEAGIVEAVTQAMMTYLGCEPREDREAFLATAAELDSAPLNARLALALAQLARSANPELAEWAGRALDQLAPATAPARRRSPPLRLARKDDRAPDDGA